jgi:hypothetical protein
MKNIVMLCWCVAAVASGMWGCVPQKNSSKADVQKEVQLRYQMGINYLEGRPQAIKDCFLSSPTSSNADIEHALGLLPAKGCMTRLEQYGKPLN